MPLLFQLLYHIHELRVELLELVLVAERPELGVAALHDLLHVARDHVDGPRYAVGDADEIEIEHDALDQHSREDQADKIKVPPGGVLERGGVALQRFDARRAVAGPLFLRDAPVDPGDGVPYLAAVAGGGDAGKRDDRQEGDQRDSYYRERGPELELPVDDFRAPLEHGLFLGKGIARHDGRREGRYYRAKPRAVNHI